ncbi:MAG: glycine cleavage system protein H, partial [Kiritimatiellales bacterium]|nr:glycine cleavage system protein H [Kiritimatiellales bacterium]
MAVPQDLFYAKTHEWVSLEDGIATIGITDFAQSQLSDLTFVELPEVG